MDQKNESQIDSLTSDKISVTQIIISTILLVTTIITIIGNIIVLASFRVEKKLRSVFNIYIANLAVTDLSVAIFAMSFYTFDILLGYWPFGEFLCGMWIFFDYGMTFASVFTLVAISVDRFYSVTWSIHYRSHNNKRKVIMVLTIVWLAMVLIWLPPCIYDRMKWSEPGVCKWEPSNNKEFVVFIAIIGHHTPCLVLLFCYIKVFLRMRKRWRAVKPTGHVSTREETFDNDISMISGTEATNFTTYTTAVNPIKANNQEPGSENPNEPSSPDKFGHALDKASTSVQVNHRNDISDNKRSLLSPVILQGMHADQSTGHSGAMNAKQQTRVRKRGRIEKEKKIFVTLSYIIFSYLICWVPFHVVFDISAIRPDLVPEIIYTISFWMTYLNSTVNPFLYAFSSKEFRDAFIKVIKCYCCRKMNN